MVTATEGIGRSLLVMDGGMRRVLLGRLDRDTGGDSEWFVFACAVKSALREGEHPDAVRTRRRSPGAEPFLRRWQGTMTSWASRNCDVLKGPQSCLSRRSDRRCPASNRVLIAPASPARPALPVLRRPEFSLHLHRSTLPTP